jgi:hypothetical protein
VGGEEQRIRVWGNVIRQVVLNLRHEFGRYRDSPHACLGLGCVHAKTRSQPHHSPSDVQHPGIDVDVLAAKFGQLTEPQVTPRGQGDGTAQVLGIASVATASSLMLAGTVWWARSACPAPRRRAGGVHSNQFCAVGGRQDGVQHPIAVGPRSSFDKPTRRDLEFFDKPAGYVTIEATWRLRVRPRWGDTALGDIRPTAVQQWVSDLGRGTSDSKPWGPAV